MYPKSAGSSKALARQRPPGFAEEDDEQAPIPFQRRSGRGASSNKSGRFEREQTKLEALRSRPVLREPMTMIHSRQRDLDALLAHLTALSPQGVLDRDRLR